jgi:hypothetical protein
MTTKQAALLAAVGTTLQLLTFSILPFISLGAHAARLYILLVGATIFAALPVFFVCVYLNEPPLAIPERLRRPALMTAVAAGLSAAQATLREIWNFSYWWSMSGLTAVLGAIVVSLFFFTVAGSSAQPQDMYPRLKKAAVYAGVVSVVGAAYTIFMSSLTEISSSTQPTLSVASGMTPGTGLWYRTLRISSSLFYDGSLAWFFFQFYKTVPAAQSSQRLSSGE